MASNYTHGSTELTSSDNTILVELTSRSKMASKMQTVGTYFSSSKRSGGGELKYIQPWTGNSDTYLLEFEQAEVTSSVLKRKHNDYKVRRYQLDDAFDEISAHVRSSVCQLLLERHQQDFQQLKQYIENNTFLGVKISQTDNGYIIVQGNFHHLAAFNDYIASEFSEELNQIRGPSAREVLPDGPARAPVVEPAVDGYGISDSELDDESDDRPLDEELDERELAAGVEKMATAGETQQRGKDLDETGQVNYQPWLTGRSSSSAPINEQPLGQMINGAERGPAREIEEAATTVPASGKSGMASEMCDRSIHEFVKTTQEFAHLIDKMPDGAGILQEGLEDQPMMVNVIVQATTTDEAKLLLNEYRNLHIQIGGSLSSDLVTVKDLTDLQLQEAFKTFKAPEGFTFVLVRGGNIRITAPQPKLADARAQIIWHIDNVRRQQVVQPSRNERKPSAGGNANPLLFEFGTLVVKVYKADITRLNVDAIVNAANGRLQHDGGVARAISKAAGDAFEWEGREYCQKNGEIRVGQVYRQMSQGNLKETGIKSVIHAIGPMWRHGVQKDRVADLLRSAVLKALQVANLYEHQTIALPAISSGIYGVPLGLCAKTYREAVQQFVTEYPTASVKEIHFVDIADETLEYIANEFASTKVGSKEKPQPKGKSSHGRGHAVLTMYVAPQGSKPGGRKQSNEGDNRKHEKLNLERSEESNQVPSSQTPRSKGKNSKSDLKNEVKDKAPGPPSLQNVTPKDEADNEENLKRETAAGKGSGGRNRSKTDHNSLVTSATKALDADRSNLTTVSPPIVNDRQGTHVGGAVGSATTAETQDQNRTRDQGSGGKKTDSKKAPEDTASPSQQPAAASGDTVSPSQQPAAASGDTKEEESKASNDCPICNETITADTKLHNLPCKHILCHSCAVKMLKFRLPPRCPSCNKYFATFIGKQPDHGTMDIQEVNFCLVGYERDRALQINYRVDGCTQQEFHPNPGVYATGTSRTAYLPGTSEGRKLAHMLKRAFHQKLIFTVGRSSTTGTDNMVTWNDIHHKTAPSGVYGYPDPTYLDRLEAELNDKGIF